jgi:hypothetical protein
MTGRWTTQEKLLLAVICGVVFLDTLDLSLVQVALPSIGSALLFGGATAFNVSCCSTSGRARISR